jgi:hypothetical protein
LFDAPGRAFRLYQAHRIFYTAEEDGVAIRSIDRTSLDTVSSASGSGSPAVIDLPIPPA